MRVEAPASPQPATPTVLAGVKTWAPLVGLGVLAFAIRWPYLWDIPQFTDETFDGLVSYGIYQGKRPLVGVNAYTGAFHYYVQAALFWLFGPSVYTPRLLVMVLGVGAAMATFLLGAEVGRRVVRTDERGTAPLWAGLIAGGLLATSAVHVLANSHLAWPHCTLPFYVALAFWLIERALRLKSGASLVLGGLAFGLAQQQHPTIVLLWPVMIGYVLWRGAAFLRTRWAYLAIAAFLIGAAPLVVYNIRTDFGTLRESQQQRAGYQQGRDKDWSYAGRAAEILVTSARLPASAIEPRSQPAEYLTDPIVVTYTALAIAGLFFAARLGMLGPGLAVIAFLILLPLFPASHDNLPRQGRYLMPLLPLAFAGVGGLFAWALVRLRHAPRAQVGVALIALVIVGYPLLPLTGHYQSALASNETNGRYFITLEAIEQARGPTEMVVLDPSLQRDRTGAAGTALRTFDFLLTVREIPHVTLEQSSDRIERRVSASTAILVADERPGSITNPANAGTWRADELPNAAPGGFALWRLTRG